MHESSQPKRVLYRPAGTGTATWAMDSLFVRPARPGEADGLDVAVVTQPPGVATPLHRHSREAEAFFLLDGTMTYRAGDETYRLATGDFIYLPSGIPHAFRVTGSGPVRFVGLTVPGGLFDMYEEIGIPAAERRLPGADGQSLEVEIPRWNDVGPRYGLEVVGPPLPQEA